MAQGVIGKPLPRPDGPPRSPAPPPMRPNTKSTSASRACSSPRPSRKGRVTRIDEAGALAMDGVIAVITDERLTTRSAQGTAGEAPPQHLPQVDYWGQPIALVVAETFEQARDAAKRLVVEYDADDTPPVSPDDPAVEWETRTPRRSVRAISPTRWREAAQPSTSTSPPRATPARRWSRMPRSRNGTAKPKLTVHSSLQMLNYNVPELADSLGLEEEQVHILSPYVGGGFGSKLGIAAECVAAAHRGDGTRPPGARGDEPAAGIPVRHAPFGDAPAPAPRRRRGRTPDRLRSRRLGHQPAGRGLRRTGPAGERVPLSRRQPAAPQLGGAHPPRDRGLRPRAGRGGRHAGARSGDGRTGQRRRHRPGRTAPAQYSRAPSHEGHPLLLAQAGRMSHARAPTRSAGTAPTARRAAAAKANGGSAPAWPAPPGSTISARPRRA